MPNGTARTMKENQDTQPSRSAAPEQDGALRDRVTALEAESRHAATKADLSEQISRLREDTNRQFAELRAENAQQRADAVEREARMIKQIAALQSSGEARISSIPCRWGGGFWLISLALMVIISRT